MDRYEEKISIIIPVYGVEQYLERCIDSVLQQTYRNLEIILVDDGSPDDCPKICDEYAQKDNRIIVLHKKNGGLSSARNAALDVATGNYILCVDSDDYIHPRAVEKLYDACITYNSDISVGLHYIEKGDKLLIEDPIVDEIELYNSLEGLQALVSDKKIRNYAWNKLYKSSLFENVRYPEGRSYEDIATTYLLFHKADKVCRIPEYLYFYQMREDSISNNTNKEKWYRNCKDIVWSYKQQFDFFTNKNEKQLAKISLYHLVRNVYALIDAGYQSGNSKEAVSEIDFLLKHKQAIYSNELLTTEAKKRLKIYEKFPNITGVYLKAKKTIRTTVSAKRKLKDFFKYHGVGLKNKYNFTLADGKDTRLIFFEQTCYDDLGKHSIAFAAQDTLKKYAEKHQNCQIYIVNEEDSVDGIAQLKQCIGENDIIFYPEFGNTENTHTSLKNKIRKFFSKQRIVILTQSAYITTKHKHYCNEIELPDITSYLDKRPLGNSAKDRQGILLCLCSNSKSTLKTSDKKQLQTFCESLSSQLLISDTVMGYNITKEEREAALNAKWNLFGNTKTVVTDSFQSMLFALITETPCVVLLNKQPDAAEELTDCEYIFYANSIEQAKEKIKYAYEIPTPSKMYLPKDIIQKLESLLT